MTLPGNPTFSSRTNKPICSPRIPHARILGRFRHGTGWTLQDFCWSWRRSELP